MVVIFLGCSTNLHAVWDTGIIESAMGVDERSYALRLVREITPVKLGLWSKGDSVTWAKEGYEIAADVIYGKLPHSGTLPDSYEAEAPTRAGWRATSNDIERLSAVTQLWHQGVATRIRFRNPILRIQGHLAWTEDLKTRSNNRHEHRYPEYK